uniref:Uncharacterized protein n=1 Tax=Oncorhynchus tshawytscha TaxID=74940 RepID=A0A8C8GLS7_ONCTS
MSPERVPLCLDLLPALRGEDTTKSFFQELVNILLSYVCKSFRRSSKVLDFHHPHQLREGLEGFSLELPDQPENLEQLLVDCRDTLKYGVKTGTVRAVDCFAENVPKMYYRFTYEVSPVFILMEEILLRKMQEIVGWSEEEGDGVFCPGGTMSNLYSVLLARYHFFPEVKTKGMTALPRLILFTSAHSHYSVKKSAAVLGIGSDNVVVGCVPFYVNATAGTTVYGAFDPLNAIADICESHGLWLHVDAAWGGGLLMSKRHRVKLQGIERAWSVTWNPHKMMGAPLQCSAILVKKRGLLKDCNQMCAEYLFQTDKHYDTSYDTGDKTIQCGRHVDVFKLWLMWKAKGSEGFESQVNKCLENAEHLFDKLKQRPDFELVFKSEPEHSNVCFWYIPPSLRNMSPGPERNRRLHEVAPKIKAKMMEQGMAMIGYQPLGDKVNFFRCVFSNPATQTEDVDYLLEEIASLGHDICIRTETDL